MGLKYPKFIGKNQAKMALFRLQKQHPVGDPKRYPIGMRLPIPVDISFGVRTPVRDGAMRLNNDSAIKASANKIKAKKAMSSVGVRVLPTFALQDYIHQGALQIDRLDRDGGTNWPMVWKHTSLSGGREMVLIEEEEKFFDLIEELHQKIQRLPLHEKTKTIARYFLEPYFPATAEYRFHASPWLFGNLMTYNFDRNVRQDNSNWGVEKHQMITRSGVFCIAKKLLKTEARDAGRWYRNVDDGSAFMKYIFEPQEFPEGLLEDVVLALKALDLDFGCLDVLVGSAGDYVILESNSNPGIRIYDDQRPALSITAQAYLQAFGRIIMEKAYYEQFYRPTLLHQNRL